MPFSNPLSLGTIGLKARDLPWFAFEKADVVICVGYDMVEYHPDMWNPQQRQDDRPHRRAARRGRRALHRRGRRAGRHRRRRCAASRSRRSRSERSPFQPRAQGARRGPRRVRRTTRASRSSRRRSSGTCARCSGPTTSRSPTSARTRCGCRACTAPSGPTPASSRNGFASMGIAVPGAIAAKLAYPDRKVIAVTGDAGFMMNSQEIETALRMKTPFVILIWNDSEYGLITWHQLRHFGRPEPHRVQESRLREVRRELRREGLSRRDAPRTSCRRSSGRSPTTRWSIIDCPVDYSREHEAHAAAEGLEVAAVALHGEHRMKIRAAVLNAMGAKPPYAKTTPAHDRGARARAARATAKCWSRSPPRACATPICR